MAMENIVISKQALAVFDFVAARGSWVTSREIAEGANVVYRTARHHARKFVMLGMFDEERVFPGFKYRLKDKMDLVVLAKLKAARKVFA